MALVADGVKQEEKEGEVELARCNYTRTIGNSGERATITFDRMPDDFTANRTGS